MKNGRTLVKVAGGIVGVLVVAVIGLLAYVNVAYAGSFERRFDAQAHAVAVPTDEASLAEGRRLLGARGCIGCHGDDLGGKVFLDDPGLGRLYSSNLTPGRGSRVPTFSDADLERAIRHSVRPDGTSLVFMPAKELWHLGDAELGMIIQAIRALPPVDREQPAHEPSLVLKALSVFDVFELVAAAYVDHAKPHAAPPPPGPTPDYGKHLAVVCVGCHGEGLSGGRIPGTPDSIPAPTNLTPSADGLGRYDEARFVAAMRTGKRPDGSDIDPFMPWKVYGHMSDDELKAIYAYLKSLPPRPFGGR